MKLLKVISRWMKPKKVSYILKSPHGDVTVPNVSIAKYAFEHVHKWADKPLVTCGHTETSYTHGETKERTYNLARSLRHKIGIKTGEVIGLILPNVPEFAVAIYGASEAGIVVTFVNPTYTAEEIKRQFVDSGVVCIIATPELKEVADKVRSELKGYKGTITVGGGGEWDLLALSEPDPSLAPLEEVSDPHKLAVLPYSSGTTGFPKGVMLSHYNCVANLEQILHPEIIEIRPTTDEYQEKGLTVLPFFHIYGFNGILNTAIRKGIHLITIPKFTPQSYADCLLKYKPSTLFLVPSLLMFLATHPSITAEHLSCVGKVVCGAAPATKALIDLFKNKIGRSDVVIQQGYGMTESSPCTLLTPFTIPDSKTGSTGTVMPGTEAKVTSITTGETLPAYESGELHVRGPQVMLGYLNNEKATKETVDSDGWLHTGDVAHYDNDGYFYITDRTKELIKVQGNQVSPTELESIIIRLDGVTDVAVIGVADAKTGEKPMAFVVCRPDKRLREEDVVRFVEGQVASYKRLAGGVRFLDAIPRNSAGKILRKDLKALIK